MREGDTQKCIKKEKQLQSRIRKGLKGMKTAPLVDHLIEAFKSSYDGRRERTAPGGT